MQEYEAANRRQQRGGYQGGYRQQDYGYQSFQGSYSGQGYGDNDMYSYRGRGHRGGRGGGRNYGRY